MNRHAATTVTTIAQGRNAANHSAQETVTSPVLLNHAAGHDRGRAGNDHLVEDRRRIGDNDEQPAPDIRAFSAPKSLITPIASDAMMTSTAAPDGTTKVKTQLMMMRPSTSRE